MLSNEAHFTQAMNDVGDAFRNLSVATQGVSNSLDSVAKGIEVTIDALQSVANGLQDTADAIKAVRASNDSVKASVDATCNAFTRLSVVIDEILVVMRDLRDERQNGA